MTTIHGEDSPSIRYLQAKIAQAERGRDKAEARVAALEALCNEAYLFADWWELEDTYPIALRNRLKAAGRGEAVGP